MTSLKLMTYNIHKGFSFSQRLVLAAIKAAIDETAADLVFLQEVPGENQRHAKRFAEWPENHALDFLADTLWPHSAYGKNAVYSHGHHGNAFLSRHPILKWENIDISNNRFERRGLLHATVQVNSQNRPVEIHAICVHLDLFAGGRAQQAERIAMRIREHVPNDAPLILAGDFNDWRETLSEYLAKELSLSEAFQVRHGEHAKSFPAWFPFLRLDRIYLRGFEVIEAECLAHPPWDGLSDHGALLAQVALL